MEAALRARMATAEVISGEGPKRQTLARAVEPTPPLVAARLVRGISQVTPSLPSDATSSSFKYSPPPPPPPVITTPTLPSDASLRSTLSSHSSFKYSPPPPPPPPVITTPTPPPPTVPDTDDLDALLSNLSAPRSMKENTSDSSPVSCTVVPHATFFELYIEILHA